MTFSDAKQKLFQNPMNQTNNFDVQYSDFVYVTTLS